MKSVSSASLPRAQVGSWLSYFLRAMRSRNNERCSWTSELSRPYGQNRRSPRKADRSVVVECRRLRGLGCCLIGPGAAQTLELKLRVASQCQQLYLWWHFSLVLYYDSWGLQDTMPQGEETSGAASPSSEGERTMIC